MVSSALFPLAGAMVSSILYFVIGLLLYNNSEGLFLFITRREVSEEVQKSRPYVLTKMYLMAIGLILVIIGMMQILTFVFIITSRMGLTPFSVELPIN